MGDVPITLHHRQLIGNAVGLLFLAVLIALVVTR